MTTLSVAMCTYNGATFLPAQLESIARQERLPDELVIGDDSSTDDSVAIVRKFSEHAPFPVSLHVNDRNVGSTKNFELTISRCQGQLIALSDQDDVWLPSKLRTLGATLDQKPDVGLVFSDAELVNDRLQPLGCRLWDVYFHSHEQQRFLEGQWLEVLLFRNVVTGATLAFRADLRGIIFPIPRLTKTIHDGWIALAVGAFAKLDFISEPLLLCRQHKDQQLGVDLGEVTTAHHLNNVVHHEDYAAAAGYYEKEIARLSEACAILTTLSDRAYPNFLESEPVKASWESLSKMIELAQDLIAHYSVRGQLAPQRVSRIGPVCRELSTGRYHRHSRGMLSAFKDLVR